jgi:hypothetical protein
MKKSANLWLALSILWPASYADILTLGRLESVGFMSKLCEYSELLAPIVRGLIHRLEGQPQVSGFFPHAILGMAKFEREHARRRIFTHHLFKFFDFLGGPMFPRVSI